jgi:glutathione S-transferase
MLTLRCRTVASFSWVNVAYFAGVDLSQFPNVERWWERIHARPAVQRGTSVPSESKNSNTAYKSRMKEEPEFQQKEAELKDSCEKAKVQYNYKFASP